MLTPTHGGEIRQLLHTHGNIRQLFYTDVVVVVVVMSSRRGRIGI